MMAQVKYFMGMVLAFSFFSLVIYVYIVTEHIAQTVTPKLNSTSDIAKYISHLTSNKKVLPVCKMPVRNCTGNLTNDWFNVSEDVTYLDKLNRHTDVEIGGTWIPKACQPKNRIAIIVPFRHREEQLPLFTRNIIPFLKAQNKAFTIFVLEQTGPALFSRAALMNAGFLESQKLGNYTCFIFHDVDMLPVHLCNEYECPTTGVRHLGLSKNLSVPHYVYVLGVGGASAFSEKVFQQINGFTNTMFGWGGEDDEAHERLINKNIKIHRHSAYIGNYFALKKPVKGDKTNQMPERDWGECRRHSIYMKYDGINTVNYKIEKIIKDLLCTRIFVHLPGPSSVGEANLFFNQQTKKYSELLKKGAKPPELSTSVAHPIPNPNSITNNRMNNALNKAPKVKLNLS